MAGHVGAHAADSDNSNSFRSFVIFFHLKNGKRPASSRRPALFESISTGNIFNPRCAR
jgi:hypothetical protein